MLHHLLNRRSRGTRLWTHPRLKAHGGLVRGPWALCHGRTLVVIRPYLDRWWSHNRGGLTGLVTRHLLVLHRLSPSLARMKVRWLSRKRNWSLARRSLVRSRRLSVGHRSRLVVRLAVLIIIWPARLWHCLIIAWHLLRGWRLRTTRCSIGNHALRMSWAMSWHLTIGYRVRTMLRRRRTSERLIHRRHIRGFAMRV